MEIKFKKSQANIDKPTNKELVDLTFVGSEDIHTIESGIRKAVQSTNRLILSVCLAMYKIEKEKLYEQLGYNSIYQYLQTQNIIPYSTAREYAYIGRNFLQMKEDLDSIGFTEENGYSKLKMVPKTYFDMKKEHKKEFLDHLKNDSLSQFKRYVIKKKKLLPSSPSDRKQDIFSVRDILEIELAKYTKEAEKLDKKEKEKIVTILSSFVDDAVKQIALIKKNGKLRK